MLEHATAFQFLLNSLPFCLSDTEPPDPPTNVRNNTVESRWVVIRWNRPKFNGNSPITNYTVEVSTNNNTWKVASCENGSPECTVPESTPTAKIIGLIPFTNYYFRVRAANNDGRGNPSDVLGPVTTDEEGNHIYFVFYIIFCRIKSCLLDPFRQCDSHDRYERSKILYLGGFNVSSFGLITSAR